MQMSKATGEEIRAFYDIGWPTGFDWSATATQIYSLEWVGEDVVARFLLDPTGSYDLRDFGYFQPGDSSVSYFSLSFEEAFLTWRKRCREQPAASVADQNKPSAPKPGEGDTERFRGRDAA
jgi:hypothetical protein